MSQTVGACMNIWRTVYNCFILCTYVGKYTVWNVTNCWSMCEHLERLYNCIILTWVTKNCLKYNKLLVYVWKFRDAGQLFNTDVGKQTVWNVTNCWCVWTFCVQMYYTYVREQTVWNVTNCWCICEHFNRICTFAIVSSLTV